MLLIIGGGVAHGYLDNRWTNQDAARVRSKALLNLPLKVGKWELVSSTELEDSTKRILQCYGSILHEYVNNTTGAQVTVFVVCGPRGPIAVHTPEVCYSSSGTEPAGDRVASPMLINGDSQSLWTVKFRKPRSSDPPHLEVWYGWSDGGPWQAASLPRVWLTDTLY
ncbi:EpsI family protein, partial [bacterium]|nr:EpsI family protein [bacterium]